MILHLLQQERKAISSIQIIKKIRLDHGRSPEALSYKQKEEIGKKKSR